MYKSKKNSWYGILITTIILILIVIFSNKETNTSFLKILQVN